MLIDINSNIGHWPFIGTNFKTCSELLDRMNRFGVDLSVISNMNGIFYKNCQRLKKNSPKKSRRLSEDAAGQNTLQTLQAVTLPNRRTHPTPES